MAVEFERKGHVGIVTINRPEAMNAIDPETRAKFREVFARIDADDDLRVVIVTGAGDRAFSAGSDLKKTGPGPENPAAESYGSKAARVAGASITEAVRIDKPTIAAINGVAIGGGLELAMTCDIRIASAGARFGLAEVKIGSIPGSGGTQRLPRLVGLTNALPMLLTGDLIDATEALRIGLVYRVVPSTDLMAESIQLAEKIAANAPLAVRAVKRLARQGLDMPLANGLTLERTTFGLLRDTKDRMEGRVAFREKRKPVFKGE